MNFLLNPILLRLAGCFVVCGGLLYYGYNKGYDARDAIAIAERKELDDKLIAFQKKEIVVNDRVVKEYVDRIVEIHSTSKEIIESIKELPNEINSCVITDDVTRLYNKSLGFGKGS